MSNCTYRFTGPAGKEVTIVGKATMKAFPKRQSASIWRQFSGEPGSQG